MKPSGLRTIVCGSTFGQFYLEALSLLPGHFELVGLLAGGSERSRLCARDYNVPLFTDITRLPADVDVACVVLRSGVLGGKGTELSLGLLERGIHVMQEQPIHHKDMARCLKTAKQNGVRFQIGDLYARLTAVRRFAAAARALQQQQEALYLNASFASQVSYPLIHMLQEVLPALRPFKVHASAKTDGPFRVLTGMWGNVPFMFNVHHEVDPDDPDNHLHLLHRITLGTAGGSLTLTDTHGPVVWQPRLHVPGAGGGLRRLAEVCPEHLLERSTETLGPSDCADYRHILTRQWPRAIADDLLLMKERIADRAAAAAQRELLCAEQWHELTAALGYPALRPGGVHRPLSSRVLKEAAAAIADENGEKEEQSEQSGQAKDGSGSSGTSAYENRKTGSLAESGKEDREHVRGAAYGNGDTAETKSRGTAQTACIGGADIASLCFGGDPALETCAAAADERLRSITAGQIRQFAAGLNEASLSSMVFALQTGGMLLDEERTYKFGEIIEGCRVAPQHRHVIRRWLRVLAEHGLVARRGEAWSGASVMTEDRLEELWSAVRALWDGKLGSPLVMDYLLANVRRLPQLMDGGQQAAYLLFPQGRAHYADALYRETVTARYLNLSVAEAVMRIAAARAGQTAGAVRPIRIVEIGAGTGATTDEVVARLKAAEGRIAAEYLFTDLSGFFIASSRRRFQDYPSMSFQILDIDQDFIRQGLEEECADIVIAAGVLNNALDTDRTVRRLLRALRPGGWLLMTEPTGEFPEMLISQAFMMTRPEDGRKDADSTFMTERQWREVFRRAGAGKVLVFPGENHALAPLGQKMMAVNKYEQA